MDASLQAERPRVMRARIGPKGLESFSIGPWSHPDPAVDAVGRLGGAALAAALLWEADPEQAPLVLAVGPAVRRGLPTAARLTVASRAPLTGRLAEGQVGSDLAARLSTLGAALVVEGRGYRGAGLLVLEADGSARVEAAGDLLGLAPGALAPALGARFGDQASLRVGPAGARGVAFASLAAGGERPSFVGRGGLGAVLGRLGLLAVVVRAEAPSSAVNAPGLLEALARSPRLASRAAQGTTELWHALSARGELRGPDATTPLEAGTGARLAEDARAAGRERQGCRGCPTPCGWVFERSTGERQRSHFGAAQAVGPALGLVEFDATLALLAACDAQGVDAKEAGAVLATWCEGVDRGLVEGPNPRGDVAALERTLGELLVDPRAARGAAALALALGLDRERLPWLERTVRPGVSGAALLGQCVSSGGSDPMRSFAFLADDSSSERVRALTGLEDPSPGLLVWWHENLVAALDASGFCAFSAAGLLADGVCSLDALAGWLGHADGSALIAAGASSVLLRRELEARWAVAADRDRPASLAAVLDAPGMLDDYRAARGVDGSGRPTAAALARLGQASLAAPVARPPGRRDPRPAAPASVRADPQGGGGVFRVQVRATGLLWEAMAGESQLEVPPPATVDGLLEALVARHPATRRFVGEPGARLASVWRRGRRLGSGAQLASGDRLDLVLAIAGG